MSTIIPVSRFARGAKKAATRSQASLGQLSMMATEQLNNLPVVQAYRAEPGALERFDAEQARYLRVMKRSLFIRGAFSPTTEYLGVIGIALAVIIGVRAVQADPSLAGHLISFLTAALLLYQPVKSLSNTASQVALGAGAATRLFEVLDTQPELDAGGLAAPLARAVRFEDVRLTYADGREALRASQCRGWRPKRALTLLEQRPDFGEVARRTSAAAAPGGGLRAAVAGDRRPQPVDALNQLIRVGRIAGAAPFVLG